MVIYTRSRVRDRADPFEHQRDDLASGTAQRAAGQFLDGLRIELAGFQNARNGKRSQS